MTSPLTNSNFTQWLKDTNCSHIQQIIPSYPCTDDIVTPSMVDFLNLTTAGLSTFKQAYCINPPEDDDCPFGYCPNSDVAGKAFLWSAKFSFYTNVYGDEGRLVRIAGNLHLSRCTRMSRSWPLPSICDKRFYLCVHNILGIYKIW